THTCGHTANASCNGGSVHRVERSEDIDRDASDEVVIQQLPVSGGQRVNGGHPGLLAQARSLARKQLVFARGWVGHVGGGRRALLARELAERAAPSGGGSQMVLRSMQGYAAEPASQRTTAAVTCDF